MVEQTDEQLDLIFRALGDPTRRKMLRLLSDGERSIGELGAPFEMSFEGVSKHVRVLENAGLVQRTVIGRTHVCRLSAVPMAAAGEWIRFYERFWSNQLDRLQAVLEAQDADAARAAARKEPADGAKAD